MSELLTSHGDGEIRFAKIGPNFDSQMVSLITFLLDLSKLNEDNDKERKRDKKERE